MTRVPKSEIVAKLRLIGTISERLTQQNFCLGHLLMIRHDEYWERALAAFKYAKQAANEEDRAAWLRIAEGFMGLYRDHQLLEEESFGSITTDDLQLDDSIALN